MNAHRFIFDSRDEAAGERLEILTDAGCVALPHHLQLPDACPRDIQVTQAIQEVKRALMFRRI